MDQKANNPYPFDIYNAAKLKTISAETALRYTDMLEKYPEPNWEEIALSLILTLSNLRDSMSRAEELTVMRVTNIAKLVDKLLHDPQVAGTAMAFLEESKKAMEIIALEQMMGDDATN